MAIFRCDGPSAKRDEVAAALAAVSAYLAAEEIPSRGREPRSRWVEQARLEGVSHAAAWNRLRTRDD